MALQCGEGGLTRESDSDGDHWVVGVKVHTVQGVEMNLFS
jgi:hypothetical protein